ncbi:hypothetical protein EDD16DRAFT_1882443 [Pisolithus croceorrhizus]|nr:hypothetical protein EDD16DRAFT_1882443 [Pisolithus croceorrhizus]
MHIFTPNHVALIAACYPPASALLASGSDYRPKSQELSRLTYYAANHPGKINKLGADCSKSVTGNLRARASLLITLAIVRTLAIECRRDISLLSPSLFSCLRTTLDFMSSDLEVCALAASVFTAWCTYTDGHVIGVDGALTQNYLVVVKQFSTQCNAERRSFDDELKNRTRLVGLSAVTGVVNSEALYVSATQFKPQASSLTSALLPHIIHADLKILAECEQIMKDTTDSTYLAEFRRASSIHAHVDGEVGPSSADVLSASIRVLSQLFKHSNATQLWAKADQCRWFAKRACDWAQYQYRYAIPSQVVERLLEAPDSPVCTSEQKTLVGMLTTVFTSSTPLTSYRTLITLVFRRVVANPNDDLLPLLVESIASLGARVYYSDQIQDLASELASRLTTIDTQSSVNQRRRSRSQAIRCLLAGLLGLMFVSDGHRGTVLRQPSDTFAWVSQRTKVSGDIWHDTLTDYAQALVTYLRCEIPKVDVDRVRRSRDLAGGSSFMLFGDSATRSLHTIHAYLFLLATSSYLGSSLGISVPSSYSLNCQLSGRLRERFLPRAWLHPSDYALILHVLTAIHEEVPVRGLLTAAAQRAFALKEDLSNLSGHMTLPQIAPFTPGVLRPPETQIAVPRSSEEVLVLLASSKSVQEATALDQQGLIRKLGSKWTPAERPNHNRPLGDGVPPLLKLSPALMAIENLSLQSLTRSVRGVGVMDLREALEGRAGASNPTLARQPSTSTLNHTSPDQRSAQFTTGSGEVRDVLNRLGIRKYSGNSLLKASFPAMHKSDQK